MYYWQVLCAAGTTWLVNADMLTSSLSDVGLLVLANQCWDEELMREVRCLVALVGAAVVLPEAVLISPDDLGILLYI